MIEALGIIINRCPKGRPRNIERKCYYDKEEY